MAYRVFKGLQKPLVFFGLKDKYIYYSAGAALGSLLLGAILSSIFGVLALLFAVGIGGAIISFIFKIQDKKGLYNKTKNTDQIHIINKQKF
ncbi:MAG: DUF4133 domain-containing protein [Weeksellaceae bacterium]|nr:DUF4133 domain-containing protein [Acholeplasmataceae bacterium]